MPTKTSVVENITLFPLCCIVVVAPTEMPTETSLENITLFHPCYITIISSHSTFTEMANYPGTKLLGVVSKLTNFKIIKNSLACVFQFPTKP